MKSKIFVAALLSASLAATPALAARAGAAKQAGQEETSGAAAGIAAQERKICKRLDSTGTRMDNQRVCMTKAEWRKAEESR